jgi:hypothetical protein
MKQEWYIVKNLEEFVESSRSLVYNNFGNSVDKNDSIDSMLSMVVSDEEKKELDSILSHEESSIIITTLLKKEINKKTKKYRYVMTEKMFLSIIESLNDRMVSNMLNGLVNKGLLETGFDEETNDFIFWIKDENKKEKRKTD